MTFWGTETKFNPFEPLRSYSWTIVFTDNSDSVEQGYNPLLDSSMLQYSLKECSKPEYDISFTEHTLLTQTFKYPGLLKWKPISIKFASTLDDKKTLEYILYRKALQDGYASPRYYDLKDEKKQVEKNSLITYREKKFPISGGSEYDYTLEEEIKGQHQQISKKLSSFGIILNQFDPDGQVIQSWILKNCFASSVSFGKLSYSSEDILEISMTVQYDYAIETEVGYYNNLKLKKAETEAEIMALEAQRIAIEEINIQEEERLKKEAIDNALNEKRQQYRDEIVEELKNKNISEKEKERIQKLLDEKDPYLDSAEILDEVAKAKATKPQEDFAREAQETQNEYARRGAEKEAEAELFNSEELPVEDLDETAAQEEARQLEDEIMRDEEGSESATGESSKQNTDRSANITSEEQEAIDDAKSQAQDATQRLLENNGSKEYNNAVKAQTRVATLTSLAEQTSGNDILGATSRLDQKQREKEREDFESEVMRDTEEEPVQKQEPAKTNEQTSGDSEYKEVSVTRTIDFGDSKNANKERDSMADEARSKVNSGKSTAVYMGGKIESRKGNVATVTYTYGVVPNKK